MKKESALKRQEKNRKYSTKENSKSLSFKDIVDKN